VWRDDKSDKEIRIIIAQDTIITAVFKTLPDDQTLTTSVVGEGTVTPVGANMYWLGEIVEVTATPTDDNIEIIMDSDMTLIANFSSIVSGIKSNSGIDLNVYPNPTLGTVQVTISDDVVGTSTLEIYDITGKAISSIIVDNGQKNIEFDLSSVSAGVYFGVLKTANKTQSFKIIKK